MTLDEAIKHCEEVAQENEKQFNGCPMKYEGAYANNGKTACKCAEEHRQLAEWLKELKALKEQEPCEDAISREAVIDMTGLSEWFDSSDSYNEFVIALSNLPSVTPQSETGHWSRKTKVDAYDIAGVKTWGIKCQCDRCDLTTIVVEDFGYYNYCPNCGAKMEEVEG